jgi:hypothetical protein
LSLRIRAGNKGEDGQAQGHNASYQFFHEGYS